MTQNSYSSQPDDEVSVFIAQLYDELMLLRFEYMSLKKKGKSDLSVILEKIEGMNEDFESLIKTQTLFLKFQKATGQTKTDHSPEILKKIKEIKANIGSIVTEVPKS